MKNWYSYIIQRLRIIFTFISQLQFDTNRLWNIKPINIKLIYLAVRLSKRLSVENPKTFSLWLNNFERYVKTDFWTCLSITKFFLHFFPQTFNIMTAFIGAKNIFPLDVLIIIWLMLRWIIGWSCLKYFDCHIDTIDRYGPLIISKGNFIFGWTK